MRTPAGSGRRERRAGGPGRRIGVWVRYDRSGRGTPPRGDAMVTWREFAAAAPDLAEAGRALLTQFGVGLAFLATVRRDGAPRLHPVCPVLSGEASSC